MMSKGPVLIVSDIADPALLEAIDRTIRDRQQCDVIAIEDHFKDVELPMATIILPEPTPSRSFTFYC